MPKPKPSSVNARVALVKEIMDDFAILIPPVESGRKDDFEMVDHPIPLKKLWEVANEFPPLSVSESRRSERIAWYAKFRKAVSTQGAFRKSDKRSIELWDRIQSRLNTLEATG